MNSIGGIEAEAASKATDHRKSAHDGGGGGGGGGDSNRTRSALRGGRSESGSAPSLRRTNEIDKVARDQAASRPPQPASDFKENRGISAEHQRQFHHNHEQSGAAKIVGAHSSEPSDDEPLIHTNNLNTSSPLLYVFPPSLSSAGPLPQTKPQTRQPSTANRSLIGDHQTDESSFAPSRSAILAATYSSSATNRMQAPRDKVNVEPSIDNLAAPNESSAASWLSQAEATSSAALVPQLVVLNLEVGSSSATLTWHLTLNQSADEELSGTLKFVSATAAAAAQPTTGDAELETRSGSGGHKKETLARLQQRGAKDKEAERGASREAFIVGSSFGGGGSTGRLIVRRDTMRLRAPLDPKTPRPVQSHGRPRQAGAEPVPAVATAAEEPETEPEVETEAAGVEGESEQATGAELARVESVAREIGRKAMLAKLDEQANASPVGASNSSISSQLAISKRLQLSREQTQAGAGVGHKRRPPTRPLSTSTTTQRPSEPNGGQSAASASSPSWTEIGESSPLEPQNQPASSQRPTLAANSDGLRHSELTSSSTLAPDSRGSPAQRRRRLKPPANVTGTQPSQRPAATSEPPVIRTQLVLLNRLPTSTSTLAPSESSSASSASTRTTTTTEPPSSTSPTTERTASTLSHRTAKSLSSHRDAQSSSTSLVRNASQNSTQFEEISAPSERAKVEEQSSQSSSRASELGTKSNRLNSAAVTVGPTATNGGSSTLSPTSRRHQVLAPSTTSALGEGPKSKGANQTPAEPSKWLVRLRRFASNEVDIVKVIVHNLHSSLAKLRDQKPIPRYISFKNLDPSSGYELCIESASPNQQVGDKFQILDANHFLKCHDTSDVELANLSSRAEGQVALDSSANTVERLDFKRANWLNEENQLQPLALPLHPSESADQIQAQKVKSLCKEFFTLPANSAEKLNFGLRESAAEGGGRKVAKVGPIAFSAENATTNSGSRRPKSLNNALRSHLELLEINDIMAPMGFGEKANMFEVEATRGPGSRIAQTGSDNYFTTRLAGSSGLDAQQTGDYLTKSILPIIGCVFALIFILTLANMLLNAITCRSSPASGSRRRRSGASRAMLGLPASLSRRQTLGSLYSDSDNSANSKSRIMVVGKHGEPFANSSAYFDVPLEPSRGAHLGADQGSSFGTGGSSEGSGGKHSSNYLLSGRFPLGPSFEGDEKHNADMVGLARKNYDNFINNIYNSHDLELSRQREGGGGGSGKSSCEPLGGDKRFNHRHVHHHHLHKRRETREQQELACKCSPSKLEAQGKQSQDGGFTGNKQRIRFDKINPIYNMESLSPTGGRSRNRSPKGVSSFGHSNPALQADEQGEQRAGQLYTDQCAACQAEQLEEREMQQRSTSTNIHQPEQPHPQVKCRSQPEFEFELEQQEIECDGEDCNETRAYRTCCLDRQKQRFEKQQQQLERVLTKNGSLIPQPFINPQGPQRCNSPSCESVVRECELRSADSANGRVSDSSDTPRGDLISQHDWEDSEVVGGFEQRAPENNDPSSVGMGANLEVRGTVPLGANASQQQQQQQQQQQPQDGPSEAAVGPLTSPNGRIATPSPPPPLVDSVSTWPALAEGHHAHKTLVSVAAMGSGSTDAQARRLHEAIDRTDFDQRRNELASKLHFANMSKSG